MIMGASTGACKSERCVCVCWGMLGESDHKSASMMGVGVPAAATCGREKCVCVSSAGELQARNPERLMEMLLKSSETVQNHVPKKA